MEYPVIEIVLGENYWDSSLKINGELVVCSKISIEIDTSAEESAKYEIHMPLTSEGKIAKTSKEGPILLSDNTFVFKSTGIWKQEERIHKLITNADKLLELL